MKSAGHIAEKRSDRLVGASHVLSLTQRNMQYTSRMVADYLPLSEKCSPPGESYLEVREVDSVYVVSQARGRETRRTMSGGVVRSFLVEFVTGQAISAQFFLTA